MQAKTSNELRLNWGDKPCEHPKLEKEYDRDASTGDYVCTQCGEAAWGKNWDNTNKKENKNAD
ncbi:hypothetical protein MED121_03492 [Marinomonas sp. MED121]|uniref:hypothetical protein n=1 Tax=Marinomonas sp. MED121 TaxID=314277 RepID=UPI000068FD50|nr:hypothetical protein [Marinomonas sp. MED121]EAQ63729.1 hypothetical protein MED121_03492 [Marinomonas sp. MED121]